MSATEELRRMLDERGVEWGNIRNDGSESDYLTEWQFEDNQGKAIAIEWAVGSGLSVDTHRYHLTPEQAIAATLCSCNCSNNCSNSERTSDNDDWISEMEWGSDEHLDGLSWDSLKSEVRWWHERALEMEAENTKLIELLAELYEEECDECDRWKYRDRMRELGVDDG